MCLPRLNFPTSMQAAFGMDFTESQGALVFSKMRRPKIVQTSSACILKVLFQYYKPSKKFFIS
jgi:hypothetical protein